MNECWKFFRYAEINDTDKIINIFKDNKWLSKYNHTYIQSKIRKNECIYESGVIINFTLIKKKINIGNISITSNNTLLDQIIRENLSLKNTYAHHVFTKFLNCTTGNTYLIVDINNYRAIKFYEKVKMFKLDEYISKDENKKKLIYMLNENNFSNEEYLIPKVLLYLSSQFIYD